MSIDGRLRYMYMKQWIECSKGHLNSPNAKVCWKCGEELKEVKVK